MPNLHVRPLLRIVLLIALVGFSYFATGRLILALSAPPNGAVTTIWLPSGISVASLILFGPFAAVGAFFGTLSLEFSMHTPAPGALVIALGNVGSEFLCYLLVVGRRRTRTLNLVDMRSLLRFMLAAVVSALFTSCVGIPTYVGFGVLPSSVFWSSWLTWFGSTVVGVILVAPFLVYSVEFWRSRRKGDLNLPECAAALVALALAAYLWQGPLLSRTAVQPVVLLVIVTLLWVAFRFPPVTMTLAVFSFAVSSVFGAVMRLSQEPRATEFVSIFTLQLMLGGLAVIGYLLASMVAGQKRATEELRLAAKVYDTTNEGIIVTTPDGKIIDVNNAFIRITGYQRAEILGKDHTFIGADREPPQFYRTMRESLIKTGEWQGEIWQRRADGTTLPTWLSISTVKDDHGAVTEHVGIFSDITELREAQTKLMAAARQAGMAEIATNVLHNVGNVLNSVNISATLVAERVRHSKAQGIARAIRLVNEHADDLPTFLTLDERGKLLPDYLNKLSAALAAEQEGIVEELERLTRSIDHIKGVIATQQSYAGASSMVEQVQVRDLVEDALATSADSLKSDGVTVVQEYGEVPQLLLDKARMLLILVNLIANARQALGSVADRPRRLTLRVGMADSGVGRVLRISVEDNGEGIPPENLERIFAHGFTTRRRGHGFGLHSCALAASEMGGVLTARSEGADKGATFTLELPIPH